MKFCCRKRAKGETAVTATTEEAIFRRAVMRDIIIAETVTQGTMTATSKIYAMTDTDAVTGHAATIKRDAATIENKNLTTYGNLAYMGDTRPHSCNS